MWADSLQFAEQQHLVRLFVWSEACLIVGGVMLGVLLWRRLRSPLLFHFAVQTAAWGAVTLAIALLAWQRLGVRDHAAAVQLDRLVWLNIGLDLGYVAVGITLMACGWFLGRRLGLLGAGTAVVIQGAALASLDCLFAQQITR